MPSRPALPPEIAAGLARILAAARRHDEESAAGRCDCTACTLARAAGYRPLPLRTAPPTPIGSRRRSPPAAAMAAAGPARSPLTLDEVNAELAVGARSGHSQYQRRRYSSRV
jgi:hypothetical protein